jgi:hypothetical protein
MRIPQGDKRSSATIARDEAGANVKRSRQRIIGDILGGAGVGAVSSVLYLMVVVFCTCGPGALYVGMHPWRYCVPAIGCGTLVGGIIGYFLVRPSVVTYRLTGATVFVVFVADLVTTILTDVFF